MKTLRTWVAAAAMVALSGAAHAALVFQGRLGDNTASATCTASGAGGTTKCTSFYLSDSSDPGFLGFTILNNWSIGQGVWSESAPPAAGSAQDIAADAGLDATGLDGWLLPTGDGSQAAGPLNQYRSIWNAVGSSFAGLQSQFDGVQSVIYWSGTKDGTGGNVWGFFADSGLQGSGRPDSAFYAVAVRPGDVAASVPEPQTLALALLALGAVVVARGRRPT